MELTTAQIEINPNPEYWEWFKKWWDEDFSWEGLKDKKTPEGTPLQDHYSHNSDKLIERFDREWHPVNAPYHDREGNIKKDHSTDISLARVTLDNLKENAYIGIVKPPNTFRAKQLFDHDWNSSSSFNFSNNKIGAFDNSFLNSPTPSAKIFKNSILSENTPVQSNSGNSLEFINCTFLTTYSLNGRNDGSVTLENCTFKTAISLAFNNLKIENIKTSSIIIKPVASTRENISNFNLKLDMNKANTATIKIRHPLETDKKVINAIVDISFGTKQKLIIANLNFNEFKLGHPKMGELKISNCSFSKKVRLLDRQIKKLNVSNSIFKKGISAHGITLQERAELKGIKVYQVNDFSGAKFKAGASWNPIDQGSNEGAISIIENGNFTLATFTDTDNNTNSSAVNFNDTKFVGSAKFDSVTFNGVPKFHGAELHPETSFRNMRKIPHLEQESQFIDKEIYSHYNAAFRSLRQHMEKNNNTPTAFFFGRLEMIAKEKRGATTDIPRSEILFTKWYGKLADYGQDFILPLKWLGITGLVSLIIQFLIFSITASECPLWKHGCRIDKELVGEALERGTTFLLPPFTMLTNRSVDDSSDLTLNLFTEIPSATVMVFHAVAASLLLFLFALSVKRKMQIK